MKKAHILEETRSTNKFGGIGNKKDTTKGSKYNNVTSKSRDEARKDKRAMPVFRWGEIGKKKSHQSL